MTRAEDLRKLGKKKNWVGGKEGWGLKVVVDVQQDFLLGFARSE